MSKDFRGALQKTTRGPCEVSYYGTVVVALSGDNTGI